MQPKVRLSLRWKITLPFMLLALVLALVLAYLLNQVLSQSDRTLFMRQLADRGQQAADTVVRSEAGLLEVERLIANTQGVPEALVLGDAEDLRARVLPVVINANVDVVAILDAQGSSLLALRRAPESPPGEYSALRGESYYADWPFVQRLLNGEAEEGLGDKHAGLHSIRLDARELFALFVGGPLRNPGGEVSGVVLVGEYLETLVPRLSVESGANASVYDSLSGRLLSSSLEPQDAASLTLTAEELNGGLGLSSSGSPIRPIEVSGSEYAEVLLPFVARQGTATLGVLGVSLLDAPIQASAMANLGTVARFGALALILVVAIGLLISHSITRPLVEIAEASAQVATGNLDTRVKERGSDEIGVLARSFNYMVQGLREGSFYRDLVGQATLPERPTLPMPGREAAFSQAGEALIASVLVADLRGFLPAKGAAAPSLVLSTLSDFSAAALPIISRHGGTVDRIDGGMLRAVFGASPKPLRPQVSALQAAHAALEVAEVVSRLRQRGHPGLSLCIAVATGPAIAGSVMSATGPVDTVVGEAVDVAHALQQLGREADKGGILIAEDTYRYLSGAQRQFRFGQPWAADTRGLGRQMTVYELAGRTQRLVPE